MNLIDRGNTGIPQTRNNICNTACEASPVPPIASQCEALDANLVELEKTITHLYNKLEGITVPTSSPLSQDKQPPTPVMAPLTERLLVANNILREQLNRLRDIHSRVEL